jgi:hypothetical protein
LAVADSAGNDVSILLGTGSGGFQGAAKYTVGSGPSAVAVADFNNSGQLDLAETNINDNTVDVLLGKGDGTFQPPLIFSTGAQGAGYVAVGDFNGDGKLDLAATSECGISGCANGTVAILLGNGDGTLQGAANYTANADAYSLAVSDFNGDGRPDLAVGSRSGVGVAILIGNGDGSFQDVATY